MQIKAAIKRGKASALEPVADWRAFDGTAASINLGIPAQADGILEATESFAATAHEFRST